MYHKITNESLECKINNRQEIEIQGNEREMDECGEDEVVCDDLSEFLLWCRL